MQVHTHSSRGGCWSDQLVDPYPLAECGKTRSTGLLDKGDIEECPGRRLMVVRQPVKKPDALGVPQKTGRLGN